MSIEEKNLLKYLFDKTLNFKLLILYKLMKPFFIKIRLTSNTSSFYHAYLLKK